MLSSEAVTTCLPSGLKAADHTVLWWPVKVVSGFPVAVSPEARRLVVRGRHHLLAIGTKGSGPDGTFVAGEDGKRVACGGVPEARRVVRRSHHHLLAIGTKGSGPHGTLVAGEGGKRVFCGGVPEARRLVVRGRHHLLAIGTKGSGPDRDLRGR